MSALDGFYSTWNKAKDTFGVGTPTDGSQYNGSSSQLLQMKSSIESASKHDGWQGTGADAYAAANKEHAGVYQKLADLDKKMAAEVTNAANVVTNGRNQLDTTKSWVDSAVNSLPSSLSSQAREKSLIPIANQGITQVNNTVENANKDMNTIAGRFTGLRGEFDSLTNQKFAPGEKKGDAEGLTDKDGDGKPDEQDVHKRAEQDVQDALGGNKDAAGHVEEVLNGIKPGEKLSEEQGAYLSQMQAQQHGMSVDELKAAEERLGEHRNIISNSWQLMSNDDVQFPKTETKVDALDNPNNMATGDRSQLPESVQRALGRNDLHSFLSNLDKPSEYTENARQVSTIADIVSHGNSDLQRNTGLDTAMLDWSRDTLHDPLRPSLWSAVTGAGGFPEYADARDDALADVFNAAGRDHAAVSAELGSKSGQQFLTDLHNHVWADTPDAVDNKNSVHSLISWIGDEAHSPNEETANRAGVAAHALAQNLNDNHERYVNPPDVPGGPVTPNVANSNPAMIAADAIALEPYQEALVGHNSGIKGFDPIGSPGDGDLEAARNVFEVIDSDRGAAKDFNAAAEQKVLDHQQAFAHAAAGNHEPIADTPNGDLKAAAYLQGVINGGAEQEAVARGLQDSEIAKSMYDIKKSGLEVLFGELPGKDHIPGYDLTRDMVESAFLGANPEPDKADPAVQIDTSQHAVTSTSYQVANALEVHRGVAEIPDKFFDGNQLKSPDQISTSERSEYATSLTNYLQKQGYGTLGTNYDMYYEDGAGK